jgi:purine-binding chemotaxis protein CheW
MTNPIENPKINPKVDWGEVHKRLDEANKALEKGWIFDETRKKQILKARAEAIAPEPGREEPGEQVEYVEFLLSYEKYGLESHYVREVYPLKEYTPVPCTPPFVLGIINVRGEILSIIDLRRFFGLSDTGLSDLNRVIILSSLEMEFGILADVITGVGRVALEGLPPPPPTFTGLRREYLMGVSSDRTAILDAGKILADPRIIVNEFV